MLNTISICVLFLRTYRHKKEDMGEESEVDDVDYQKLNAAQNRKNKKAGGWQAMGLFLRLRFFMLAVIKIMFRS